MYCRDCGKNISHSSNYCRFCGSVQRKDLKEDPNNSNDSSTTRLVASQNKRFLDYLIDSIGSIIWIYACAIILGFVWGSLGIEQIYSIDDLNWTVVAFLSSFFYYFLLESFFGKTLGKLITSTKVVNIRGQECTTSEILIRTICRYIPFEVLSFLSSKYPIGWHDSLSKTRVICDP